LAEPQPETLRGGRTRPKRALTFHEFAAFFADEPFEPNL